MSRSSTSASASCSAYTFVNLLTERHGGRVIAQLVGAGQTDPDLAAALTRSCTHRLLAVDRGQRARSWERRSRRVRAIADTMSETSRRQR
jgi:hypothetical protein